MVEYIYMPAKDKEERDLLEDLANTTISCFKKCEFFNVKREVVARSSKFELLSSGLCFELDDPIMDSEMVKRGITQSYTTETFIKNVKNKPKEMVKFEYIKI